MLRRDGRASCKVHRFMALNLQRYLSSSELFDVAGGHGLGRVGVTLDVPLRAVAETALQLVGVGARHLGQVEGEGMAEVMRAERRDPPSIIGQLSIVPAADLLQQQVDRAR